MIPSHDERGTIPFSWPVAELPQGELLQSLTRKWLSSSSSWQSVSHELWKFPQASLPSMRVWFPFPLHNSYWRGFLGCLDSTWHFQIQHIPKQRIGLFSGKCSFGIKKDVAFFTTRWLRACTMHWCCQSLRGHICILAKFHLPKELIFSSSFFLSLPFSPFFGGYFFSGA